MKFLFLLLLSAPCSAATAVSNLTRQDVRITSTTVSLGGGAVSISSVAAYTLPTAPVSRSSVTCLGTSTLVFPANANRKRVDCFTLDSNNAAIFAEWDLQAVSTSPIIMPPSSNYTESSTVPFKCMSVSGTQVLRCLEY